MRVKEDKMEVMLEDEIFAINYCDEKFYVDKNKILYILSIKEECNAFLLPEKDIIYLFLFYVDDFCFQ